MICSNTQGSLVKREGHMSSKQHSRGNGASHDCCGVTADSMPQTTT